MSGGSSSSSSSSADPASASAPAATSGRSGKDEMVSAPAANNNSNSNGNANGVSKMSLNPKVFWSRLKSLYENWKKGGKIWGASMAPIDTPPAKQAAFQSAGVVDAISLISGKNDEEEDYSRAAAIQLFLFTYELEDTILLFTPNVLHILTGQRKAAIIETVGTTDETGNCKVKLDIHVANKADKNAANISAMIAALKASGNGKRVGVIESAVKKHKVTPTSSAYSAALKEADVEFVDVNAGFGSWLLIKDQAAMACIEKAAELTTRVHRKFLLQEIEKTIDEGIKVKHGDLAEKTDQVFSDPSKVGLKFRTEDCDSCYSPIIQSGWGEFDLKPSAESDGKELITDSGVIIVQLGGRYKNYTSNLARTYFINPVQEQKEAYALLTAVYLQCRSALKPGNKAMQVWAEGEKVIKSRKPELLNNFTKTCGFGLGLEFRESNLVLNNKNARVLQKGMVVNLCVGFENLTAKVPVLASDGKPDPSGATEEKKYALLLADTCEITEGEPTVHTHANREYSDIAYTIGGEDEQEEKPAPEVASLASGTSFRPRVREQTDAEEIERQRRAHQQELARLKAEAALKRLASETMDSEFNGNHLLSDVSTFNSYTSPSQYPSEAKPDKIYVDVKSESVLLPINDMLVPFHISTIKNVHKMENAPHIYLTLSFVTPDEKKAKPTTDKYIRELTYRTTSTSLDQAFFQIKELRKRVQNRLKEHEAKSSLVAQEDLRLNKQGGPTLKDISVRPQLSRKKTTGTLTAHLNGLRFVTTDKIKVDIIYQNVRAAFYQPAEDTPAVLLHFELVNPILLDKSKTKKTHFLQFYVEVVDVSEDLATSNRYRDEEGLAEEQEERRRRKKWNERFLTFVKQVEEQLAKSDSASKLEFDIPYRELAFQGVPNKSVVQLLPTVHSLVALDDQPPVVIALADVEIANFERVQFGLREFDLVFVWKDFTKLPIRIDSIPVKYLEPIKQWLNSCDIVFYESGHNLVWKNVMKHITEDVEAFWKEGGFAFLDLEDDEQDQAEAEAGGGGGGGAAEEEESEFEPSGSDSGSDEYETPSSEEDEDDDDDDSDASGEDDSEEEGEDWDELDAKAKKADKAKAQARRAKGEEEDDDPQSDSDDDDRPKKKAKPVKK